MLRSYPEPLNTILSQTIAGVTEMSEIAYKRSAKYVELTELAEKTWKAENEEAVKRNLKRMLKPQVEREIKLQIVKEKREEKARHYEERKTIPLTSFVLVPDVFFK